MDENNSILGFPELKVNGSYDCEIDGVSFHVYEVQNRKHNDRCPVCGGRGKIHESVIRRIRDLDSFGMPIYLFYKVNKYDCLNCNCFFAEDISAVADDKARMTNRMREAVARRAVNYSFESVAADYNISSTTVKRAFKDWVDSKDDARSEFLYAPEVLGIDETHIGNKMSAVFTDNKNNRLLEILPGRKKPEVIEFLKSLQEPNTLKAVTTDMWKGYREAVREVFGERVPVVIDHYHVIQELNKQATKCKNNLQATANLPKGSYKDVNRPVHLFRSNIEDLDDVDKTELAKFFSIVPGLEKAYALKEAFRAIYTCGNKMDALRSFEIWESTIPEASDYEPFRKFAGTVHRWEEEIFNFFDHPYTNAFTECFNGKAKQTNREGKGYSFSVLRAKMLYGTSASSYIKVKKRKKVITSSNDPLSSMKDINFGFMSLMTPQWSYEEVTERHFGVDVKDLVKQLSDSADG